MAELERWEVGTLLNALFVYTRKWSQTSADERLSDEIIGIRMATLDRIHQLVRKLGGDPKREDFGAGDYLAG